MKSIRNQELVPDLYELWSNATARIIGSYERYFLQLHCDYEGQIGIKLMSKSMSIIKHIALHHITREIKKDAQ